jgi:hemerythrin-like metal-binding protein
MRAPSWHGAKKVGKEGVQDGSSEPLQLRWLESFETGNAEIDAVHRKLIVDCNILLAMVSSGSCWAMILARAKRVVEDCIAHFRLEESILAETQFARLSGHQAEHRRLEGQLREALLRMENREDGYRDCFAHAKSLGELLINAIVRNDLDFRSHILDRQGR